ncbi:MAG: hypothetical protein D6693_04825 [Planctomycetota bacterium]|nr:MAG: hypothetical protein D6693_04825 [Planctomycetota bacterium]
MKRLDLRLVRDPEPEADLDPIPFPSGPGATPADGARAVAHELERSMDEMQRRLDDVRRQLDDAYRLPTPDDGPPSAA